MTRFKVKTHKILPKELEKKVRILLDTCFGHQFRTTQQRRERGDKFCSHQDQIGYILNIQGALVTGVAIILKREIIFKNQPIILGGIGGLCVAYDKRRMGIATALLKIARQELVKHGCDAAYLCADIKNPGMIKLYDQIGFVPLNKPHTYLGKSGKRYTDYDGMIAPIKSPEIFAQILADKQPFDIGRGNW